ncbi:sushi domain-containing protein 2-like [Saccoglossus kowalevskii]|uniref:Protein mesh-like n=1 Tax=Saccoglossus kowalevskii TaxID=10224 RepID=A0ABM0GWV8_SACKO|nr:PREDICTED: protein mesh-like [Saccoglossus kowalevskii]
MSRDVRIRVFILLMTATFVQPQYEQTADNLVELYPYGSGQRDTTLDSGDDLQSPASKLDYGLVFYGQRHWSIYVNTNGLISFNNGLPDHSETPDAFPLGNLETYPGDTYYNMIAPFWGNVDTSRRGNIYYRQTTERLILNQATEDVRRYFTEEQDFTALWCFVATWEEVSFFGRTDEDNPQDHRNTWQVVLATDNRATFYIASYRRVEWTTGVESGGSAYTGTGGTTAQVGFNAGDGLSYFTYGGSRTADIINLPWSSNVEEPGRYAYRIDAYKVDSGGCGGTGRLHFFPHWGNLLGGDRLLVGGSCWDTNKPYFLRIGIQEFNCTYESVFRLECITPPFYEIGDIRVDLSQDGGVTYPYNGRWIIEPPIQGKLDHKVTRIDSHLNKWNVAGHDLEITWDKNEFETSYVTIEAMSYREDLNFPTWELLAELLYQEVNDGRATFMGRPVEGATHTMAVGAIRIRPFEGSPRRAIWTDVHMLGYLLEEEYQLDTHVWAGDECHTFYVAQEGAVNFRKDLYYCPCNLTMAIADFGRFEPDPDCTMEFYNSPCTYHPGAKHCVFTVYNNHRGSGSTCCYDWEEHLIYVGDDPVGGYSSEAHIWGQRPYNQAGRVPALSWYKADFLYFYECCIWSENCGYYQQSRPTADCWEYTPARPASVYGDPHFVTFDGTEYTFNAKGEYTLLKWNIDPEFEIQGRFTQVRDVDGMPMQATELTALVVKEGKSDTVQIEVSQRRNLEVGVNSRLIDFDDDITRVDFEDVSVYTPDRIDPTTPLNPINPNITEVYVRFESGVGIKCQSHNAQVMACIVSLPPTFKDAAFPDLVGLLGNYDYDRSNDLTAKDGSVTSPNADDQTIFDDFGQSWEVNPSMFHYHTGRSHSTYQDDDFVPDFEPPDESTLAPDVRENMDIVCDGNKYCEYDVKTTGSLTYGTATKSAYDIHWSFANDTFKETVCEYMRTPINGTKEFIWPYVSHNMVDSKAHFTCDYPYTLIGNYVRLCEEKDEDMGLIGRWTGIEQHNDCIDFGCPPLNTLYHGGYEWDYASTVYPICDPPYILYGPDFRTCQNGVWTGHRNECYVNLPTVGEIILAVAVVVIFVVIVLIVVYVLHRRSKKNEQGGYSDEKGYPEEIPTTDYKEPLDDDNTQYVDETDDLESSTHKETTA